MLSYITLSSNVIEHVVGVRFSQVSSALHNVQKNHKAKSNTTEMPVTTRVDLTDDSVTGD